MAKNTAPVITIEHISKRYQLGSTEGLASLREAVVGALRIKKPAKNVFWALRDVNLHVNQGETIGLIGKNGAGKSTLLKVLSRITPPTEGKITIRGRVASLLEVGTGFNPELTGRENVYLNGAILGMSRREIAAKFDEIVAFSEIEDFLDTPVKRYSSGMYVRLAFAIAAHLEPDILIIDEVLAVGDARFQKKCLGKTEEISKKDGRTVLFVSHNMGAVTRICQKSALLEGGQLSAFGPTSDVIGQYLNIVGLREGQVSWEDFTKAPGDEAIRLRQVQTSSLSGTVSPFGLDDAITVRVTYEVLRPQVVVPSARISSEDGIVMFQTNDWTAVNRQSGQYVSEFTIPANILNEGGYYISLVLSSSKGFAHVNESDVLHFQVLDKSSYHKMPALWAGAHPGLIRPELPWVTKKIS